MIPISEAYMNELAERVADKVEERLRRMPVLQPRLLTVAQVAVVLGRSEKAIRGLLASGTLRNASFDGHVQFDVRDIEILIQNSKR